MSQRDCMTAGGVVCRSAADGYVEIEFAAQSQCKGCEGMCMWRRLPLVNRAAFPTNLPLAVGDRVDVYVPQRYVLLGALLVHGLPLAALLAGGVIGALLTGTDLGCLAGAVIAVVATVLGTPGLRRRIEKSTMRQIMVRPRTAGESTA